MDSKELNLEMLQSYEMLGHRKVRRVFRVPERIDEILFLTTDNVSASDVVFDLIEGKGRLINKTSNAWKKIIGQTNVMPTDFVTDNEEEIAGIYGCGALADELKGRLLVAKKALVIPLECIVRDKFGGSLFKMYAKAGGQSGYYLGQWYPEGMTKNKQLLVPAYTPSTKAETGHDINIDYEKTIPILEKFIRDNDILGWSAENLAQSIRAHALSVFMSGRNLLASRKLELHDSKFEFGLIPVNDFKTHGLSGQIVSHRLCLVDEVLTGDSSRIFEPMDEKHYDKQFLRDFLEGQNWDGQSRFPLPTTVKKEFISRYGHIFDIAEHINNYALNF
ncbi:MAG: phosphoribosylaminoimidazolesuccinocarboxamide synthase [Candidatus Paceibacterota bacterium]